MSSLSLLQSDVLKASARATAGLMYRAKVLPTPQHAQQAHEYRMCTSRLLSMATMKGLITREEGTGIINTGMDEFFAGLADNTYTMQNCMNDLLFVDGNLAAAFDEVFSR